MCHHTLVLGLCKQTDRSKLPYCRWERSREEVGEKGRGEEVGGEGRGEEVGGKGRGEEVGGEGRGGGRGEEVGSEIGRSN